MRFVDVVTWKSVYEKKEWLRVRENYENGVCYDVESEFMSKKYVLK